MEEQRDEILRELVLKKEDKINNLKNIIQKAKDLFQIDEETKKIIINASLDIKTKDKILLVLIAKHFQKELGMSNRNSATIGEIGYSINTLTTSLSSPLLELKQNKIIIKEGSEYFIPYAQIEKSIDRIHNLKNENKEKTNVIKLKRKRGGKRKDLPSKKLEESSIEKIITDLEINKDELMTIYSLNEKDFVLMKTIKEKNIKKLHLEYSLLIAFAYRFFYNLENVDSTELREKIKDTGCPSITNLSTSLKNYPNLIIHNKGRKGNIYTTYRITQQGIEYAKQLIKKFVLEIRNLNHAH